MEKVHASSRHVAWQVPQYIFITAGEVMFSIAGVEFSYSHVPDGMKSLVQALWLLNTAVGNVIVLITGEMNYLEKMFICSVHSTIITSMICLFMGHVLLLLGAFPHVGGSSVHTGLSMLVLVLITLGTGGVKPCLTAFGGDQFEEEHDAEKFVLHKMEKVHASSRHVAWQVPQYIFITAGEVMFSIAGVEFSYSHVPDGMKSLVQALWLLNTAVGNVIVLITGEINYLEKVSSGSVGVA
ncbi:hypothetical protein HF521_015938 [Silurus meridionalis]|uniref:Uncharacterized protein n=1 Tax=Silurus meridionalis TaxID=175797 RepID=A0A8T0BPX3_SILME|nr:hypothetical protein HF521_015938 [Silurus meridionalis]